MRRSWHLPLLAALTFTVPQPAGAADATLPVTVEPAAERAIRIQYAAGADVRSANVAVLRAELAARIVGISADVGTRVRRGEPLVRLDDTDARLEVARAAADLAGVEGEIRLAASRLERARQLAGDDYVSDDELEDLDAQLAVLNARRDALAVAVRVAEEALADARITAPFDGIVTARDAQVGSMAVAGDALMTVVQATDREVEAYVAPDQVDALRDADDVTLTAGARAWPLRLLRITDVIDSRSGLQAVRFAFVDAAAPIGLSGTVRWQSAREFYPVDLVQRRGGELGVFTADGDRARFNVAADGEEGRPVRLPLAPAARIIVDGRSRLQDGDPIEIVSP